MNEHDAGQTMLSVDGLCRKVSSDFAVSDVSFKCRGGSLTGVIGPNGSGKTSLLDMICGRLRIDAGMVVLDGQELTGLSFDQIVRSRVGRTFQAASLPPELSVAQVLALATRSSEPSGSWSSLIRQWKDDLPSLSPSVMTLLRSFDLDHHIASPIGALSYGQTRLIAVTSCLLRRPRLVLLDEPLAGLDRNHIDRIVNAITTWCVESGAAVLIVEHNIRALADACDQLLLLDRGRVIAFGEPAQVLSEPRAREVFFA